MNIGLSRLIILIAQNAVTCSEVHLPVQRIVNIEFGTRARQSDLGTNRTYPFRQRLEAIAFCELLMCPVKEQLVRANSVETLRCEKPPYQHS
jgi:hypothetical protein